MTFYFLIISPDSLQPETHFFLGNLLSAKGNLTGAIAHYQEALHQKPEHEAALNGFRILRCYERFHRSQQSVVRNAAAPGPASAECPCGTKTAGGSTVQCKKVDWSDHLLWVVIWSLHYTLNLILKKHAFPEALVWVECLTTSLMMS